METHQSTHPKPRKIHNPETLEHFRRNLERLMNERNYTLSETAGRAYANPASLSRIFSEKTKAPSLDLALRLANVFDVSICDLLGTPAATEESANQSLPSILLHPDPSQFLMVTGAMQRSKYDNATQVDLEVIDRRGFLSKLANDISERGGNITGCLAGFINATTVHIRLVFETATPEETEAIKMAIQRHKAVSPPKFTTLKGSMPSNVTRLPKQQRFERLSKEVETAMFDHRQPRRRSS